MAACHWSWVWNSLWRFISTTHRSNYRIRQNFICINSISWAYYCYHDFMYSTELFTVTVLANIFLLSCTTCTGLVLLGVWCRNILTVCSLFAFHWYISSLLQVALGWWLMTYTPQNLYSICSPPFHLNHVFPIPISLVICNWLAGQQQ